MRGRAQFQERVHASGGVRKQSRDSPSNALLAKEIIVAVYTKRHSLDRQGLATATKAAALKPGRLCTTIHKGQVVERRKHERRFSDDLFYLVERRNGDLWKYGSITLCVALWANLGLLILR